MESSVSREEFRTGVGIVAVIMSSSKMPVVFVM